MKIGDISFPMLWGWQIFRCHVHYFSHIHLLAICCKEKLFWHASSVLPMIPNSFITFPSLPFLQLPWILLLPFSSIFAGSFRVSKVIDFGCSQNFGNDLALLWNGGNCSQLWHHNVKMMSFWMLQHCCMAMLKWRAICYFRNFLYLQI